jgi:hypothetical protein
MKKLLGNQIRNEGASDTLTRTKKKHVNHLKQSA